MKTCEMCEREYDDEALRASSAVAAGGWCAPSEQYFEICRTPELCGHCSARWSVAVNLGIDIGER